MYDAIVIGAGAAGLMAARELKRAGYGVLVLEASDRIGGRVRTLHDTGAGIPIELGAEFVHGDARETNRLLDEARLASVPVLGRHVRSDRGQFSEQEHMWKRMGRVFKRLDPERGRDRSFQDFLDDKPGGLLLKNERELARSFVQGFNAADAARISEKSLAQQGNPTEAAVRAARVVNGYASLVEHAGEEVVDVVRFDSLVQRILWDEGRALVLTRGGAEYEARAVVVTVPLPFLQDESIALEPEVPAIRKAARELVMGHVARVNVVVRERFWERKLDELAYVHTPERPFNVWWTQYPLRAPLLVGWSGGPPAVELQGDGDIESVALSELARAFGTRRSRLEKLVDAIHTFDWTNHPHSRGAYSYAGVGGTSAPKRLSQPVRGTLFFAGEATDSVNSGTVEGALASGRRAFRQVVKSLG
ncbi:MAG: flavin monoamine oxidase family protein [Gemmatimonadota bacterium]